ncbi:MAG: hypothetical protein D6731_19490 [Planctomycetota bacterium]|nr:MAG: hypothetical protein D6731_19490 [Planctomycetota bacterium]
MKASPERADSAVRRSASWSLRVGLALPVVVLAACPGGKASGPRRQAQLTVVAELKSPEDPEGRKALAALLRDLSAEGVFVSGPDSFPLLRRPQPSTGKSEDPAAPAGPSAGGQPAGNKPPVESWSLTLLRPVLHSQASAAELQEAQATWATASYFAPRVVSHDGRRAVVRAAPKGSLDFPPGFAARLRKALDEHRSAFAGLWAYAPSLGLNSAEDGRVVDEAFGSTLLLVPLACDKDKAPDGLWDANVLADVDERVERLRALPEVLCAASPSSVLHYARAVAQGLAIGGGASLSPADIEKARSTLHFARLKPGIAPDGSEGWLEVYTRAHGAALGELERRIVKTFADSKWVKVRTQSSGGSPPGSATASGGAKGAASAPPGPKDEAEEGAGDAASSPSKAPDAGPSPPAGK